MFHISELIEQKGKGIFDLLDEESKLPTPKPDHFTMEVHNRNKEHFRLSVSQFHCLYVAEIAKILLLKHQLL